MTLLNALELGVKASGKWSFIRYTFIAPFEKVKDVSVAHSLTAAPLLTNRQSRGYPRLSWLIG